MKVPASISVSLIKMYCNLQPNLRTARLSLSKSLLDILFILKFQGNDRELLELQQNNGHCHHTVEFRLYYMCHDFNLTIPDIRHWLSLTVVLRP